MRWLTKFYDFRFKWTAAAAIEIPPTKAWLSQLVNCKNEIWHFRRTICKKILFKHGKNLRETYGMLHTAFRPFAGIEHQYLSGIRDSRKARRLLGMMRGAGGVRNSIYQSWLAKWLGLLCWDFKGVREQIPSEEARTLQIRSVAFPPRQCTSLQFHLCHRLFDQDRHQDSFSPSV